MIFNFQWKILRRHCFNNNSKFLKVDKLTGTGMAVFEKQRYSNPNSFFLQKKKKKKLIQTSSYKEKVIARMSQAFHE